MRLARKTRGDIDKILAVMDSPKDLLVKLQVYPQVLAAGAWDALFADVVIPTLHADAQAVAFVPMPATPAIWHASRAAGNELAGLLRQGVDPRDASNYLDGLLDQGAGLEPLFREVFEPAARCLGGLWEDDVCDEFSVTLALGRLQLEAHRLSAALLPADTVGHPGHAVLIALQPGEIHGLNAALNSELFSRDGWDVSLENSLNDSSLGEILHATWFDVLDLSMSGALRRDQQLAAMRFTIGEARAASLNPALAIIVDGRTFVDDPRAYLAVGADMGCTASTNAVPAALRWLRTHQLNNLATAKFQGLVQVDVG